MTSDHPSKLKNDAYRPPQLPNGRLVNTSVDFTDNHVNEDLHRAFQDSGISYNDEYDTFFASSETPVDEKALFDSQQALSDALQQYERDAEPKFKTGLDLKETHTWEEVMNKVDTARDEYNGVGKEGYLNSIHNGLRNFHTAAPAIEAWLKLLPSNSIYGSVLCGGITMILEVCSLVHGVVEGLKVSRPQCELGNSEKIPTMHLTKSPYEWREHKPSCGYTQAPR